MTRMKKWLSLLLTVTLLLGMSAALGQEAQQPQAAAEAATTAEIAAEATTAPEASPAPEGEKNAAQWTVMLYLCGTDLETNYAMATYNLQEIAETTPSPDVNLVIETGGAKTWYAKETVGLDIATDKLQRYHYDADGYTLDEELPLDNMASASTLTDFIVWSAENYPAEKYMLVLWDHGGGSLTGLIMDELHNQAIMPLDQLGLALKNANVPLEAVVLDTCLMATLEMAQAIQDSAKYLIASEESVPGQGSAYRQWLQYLYNTPACNGARFGRMFCDMIQQKYVELGLSTASQSLTYSVIDLSKIDAVGAAFDQMFLEISDLLSDPQYFYAFGYATQHMQRYTYPVMVDVADMAMRAQNIAISNETASAVLEAVTDAVVYNVKGEQRSYSYGLAFYYEPTAVRWFLDSYAKICKSAPYLAFLDAVNMGWTAPEWVYEQTPRLKDVSRQDYIVETAVGLTEEGLPRLTITNGKNAVTTVDIVLYQYDKAAGAWLALGESDMVEGEFEDGVFWSEFPEDWMTFNDNLCQMSIVEETMAHTLYNIPFQIYDEYMMPYKFNFRMAYIYDVPLDQQPEPEPAADAENSGAAESAEAAADEKPEPDMTDEAAEQEPTDPYAGHFELYGVWDGDEASSVSLPSRNTRELTSYFGATINMLRDRVLLPGYEDMGQEVGKPFELNEDCAIEQKPLPKGDYAFAFKVTDVFGKTQISEPIEVSWNGKTAAFVYEDPLAAMAE